MRPKTRVSLRSKFGSREELLDTLIASSFVPGVTGSVAEIPAVNGATAIDGGLVRNWPRLPMNDFHTIHVSPFAGDFAICPPKSLEHATVRFMGAAVQRSPKNLATALHAIFPPAIEGLAEYSDAGYADAVAFLEGHRDEVAGVREDRAQLEGEVRALEGRAV